MGPYNGIPIQNPPYVFNGIQLTGASSHCSGRCVLWRRRQDESLMRLRRENSPLGRWEFQSGPFPLLTGAVWSKSL
ncbi:hypothetical protein SRHO_G00148310 [Serrasalmus rhombeus]